MPVYKDEERNSWYSLVRYADWTGEHKQKMKRGFKTRKEALAWEHEFLAMRAADLTMSLEAFVELYFSDKKNRLKNRTCQNKRYMIDTHVLPYLGKKAMNEVKPSDIISWQNEILKKGFKDTYMRMLQNQVTAIFNHAERLYGLRDNPCKKVSKIGKANAKELNFWTLQEFNQFYDSMDPGEDIMYRCIFDILFIVGCRCGELLALTPADIDFVNNTIKINKTFYRRDKQDFITSPKTEASIREVTIPVSLANEIKAYMATIYGGINPSDRLFQITDRAIQKKIVAQAERAGVKRIRIHDCRHSSIAYQIYMNVSPLAIARRVGHDSVNTTLNVYGHLYPNKQKEIADMMENIHKTNVNENVPADSKDNIE